ncbi:MAG: IS91 family transposase [Gammaproteobacteria bacterium]|nr:MAG: IS91 family transposase [Gammaproteobacteria bacterium]
MNLTTVIERYQAGFETQYAGRISPDQRHALGAALSCRTERYGEMKLRCTSCHWQQSRFNSCGHRSCHRCQNHDTTRWLERQMQKLLPVEYFMVTFTLPYELRAVVRQHQAEVYSAMFACAASTLKSFGANDTKLGSDMGMTAVLHTHSRRLDYHPHIHLVVPGGCLNRRRKQWKKLRGHYLFNEFALAKVFRARLLDALRILGLNLPQVPRQWVANCRNVGKGKPALKYLSRYLYRGVVSENNIVSDDGTHITFRYMDSQTGKVGTRKITGEHFLWLVFQHVLPKGFRRVRDYGFLHGNSKRILRLIQTVLRVVIISSPAAIRPSFKCLRCKSPMLIIAFIPPSWRST